MGPGAESSSGPHPGTPGTLAQPRARRARHRGRRRCTVVCDHRPVQQCGQPTILTSRPHYLAVFLADFVAGASAFLVIRAAASFFTASFFTASCFAGAFLVGAFFVAGGPGSASAVRSTTESSPPKLLGT